MRRLLFLLPVALFVLVVAAFMAGLGRDPTVLPSTLIGKTLPGFNLPPVRANDVGLKSTDLAGQPVLLNVFASWCATCHIEHPLLMQLKAEGVAVEGLDWKDEPAAGARYLVENGDPYLLAGNDRTGRAGIDLGVAAVPETFIVDRHGRVRYKHIGAIEPEDWMRTIKPLMDRLRAELMRRLYVLVLALALLAGPARAVLPQEQLADPKLEARARHIGAELRCLVCQNQSIDDSEAPLAGDLRIILRERLSAGDTDKQAIDYIAARYGTFVLLKPPFDGETMLLWLGPFLALIVGGLGVGLYLRHRMQVGLETLAPLTTAEQDRLNQMFEGSELS